jgi:PAS domain S-box-containing protein
MRKGIVGKTKRTAPLKIKGFLQKTAILDLLPDSVFIYDLKRNLIFANKAACESHGYTKQELLGTTHDNIAVPEHAGKFQDRMKELLEKGEIIFEAAHFRKDRSIIPVESHVRYLKINGEDIFFCTTRDITERKKAEEALRESQRVLDMIIETAPT